MRLRGPLVAAGVVLGGLLSPLVAMPVHAAGTDALVFTPVADTYVDSATPDTAYGSAAGVWVDANSVRRSFLRFDVQGLAGRQILDVRLRMRQLDASPAGGRVWPLDSTTWSEGDTWSSQPVITSSAPLADFGAVASGQDYEVDLGAAAVAGQGLVSFAMDSTNSDGARWASRDSIDPPQLIVVVGHSDAVAGDGVATVSSRYASSSDPTTYPSEKHLATTSNGRLLVVHGLHATGLRVSWRDPAGGWSFASAGANSDGRALTGTGSGDRPASIVTAVASDGVERAYVVWGGTAPYSTVSAMPIDGRVVTDLDGSPGPSIGASFPVAAGDQGNFRPDLAVEREQNGTSRLFVTYLHRTGSSSYQLVGVWSKALGSSAPVFGTPIVFQSGSISTLSSTVMTTPTGLVLVSRDASGRLTTWRHTVGAKDSSWKATTGSAASYITRPSATVLTDGTVAVAADLDSTNHVVGVQRFAPGKPASATELKITGYQQPTIVTDGTNLWVFAIRRSDGALVSRAWTSANGWTASDAVEIPGGNGLAMEWPNALRTTANGRLVVVTRGLAAGDQSEVIVAQRPATPGS